MSKEDNNLKRNEDKRRWREANRSKQAAYTRLQKSGVPRSALSDEQFDKLVYAYEKCYEVTEQRGVKYCVAVRDFAKADCDLTLKNCDPDNLHIELFSRFVSRSSKYKTQR